MRKIFALALALVLTFGASATALAAWSASGSGSASAASGTINPPTNVTATATGTSVDLSWTAPSSGATPAAYTVVRQPAAVNSGSSATACPSEPTTSCTESAVPAGDWYYTVVSELGQWISTAAVSSTVTVVDAPADETFQVILLPSGTKTAGDAFNVEITAMDDGVKQTAYTGSKSLTFSGPRASPNGTIPTYPGSVTFTAGVGIATITLAAAETATLAIVDGDRSGTAGVSVDVGSGLNLHVVETSPVPCGGVLSNNTSFSAKIERIDEFGNGRTSGVLGVTILSTDHSPASVSIADGTSRSATFTNPGLKGSWTSFALTATAGGGYSSAGCTLYKN